MRRLLPLVILALAGCESFKEETFPVDRDVYEVDGKAYAVKTQYDPLEAAYFTQVTAAQIGPGLTAADKDVVLGLVQNEVGITQCDGRKMELAQFNRDNLPGGGNMVFLESRGLYQVVSRCAWDVPDFIPETPELPDLPQKEDAPVLEDLLPDISSWL